MSENKIPHPVDIHVGENIRQRRKIQGITLQKLADEVDVKFQQIQKYEGGENRVSASRLFKIAEALDCKVQDFFAGLPGYECEEDFELTSPLTEEDCRLQASFRGVAPQHKEKVSKLGEALTSSPYYGAKPDSP